MSELTISCIVAADLFNGIGKDNKLPWHLPKDLKHFKEVTLGKPIIMGRKTYESLRQPLTGRYCVVLSSTPIEGVATTNCPHMALYLAGVEAEQGLKEVVIIGGAQVYKTFEDLINKVYLTRVGIFADVDTYFDDSFFISADKPKLQWKVAQQKNVIETEGISFSIIIYEKTNNL